MTERLTLRSAYMEHYDKEELAPATRASFMHDFKRWEKFTDDPDVREITNETLAKFRAACLDAGLAPSTVNVTYSRLRSVLRLLGPSERGNPFGLGIIDGFPAMKPCKVQRSRPYMIPMGDLTKAYIFCQRADYPRAGIHPSTWWRALLVLAYCTALRRKDLFELTWAQIDLKAMTLDFTARKTGKADHWPLHPVAATHLVNLHVPREGRVFGKMYAGGNGGFYKMFGAIQEAAGISRQFTLHDIRRTAASNLEAVSPGLGSEFLQHAPRSVSDVSYLNRYEALRKAFDSYPIPAGWKAGAQSQRKKAAEEQQKRAEMFRQNSLCEPRVTNAADWQFSSGQFAYRGQWFPLPSPVKLAILQTLVDAETSVEIEEVISIMRRHHRGGTTDLRKRAAAFVSELRILVKRVFACLDDFDPIPCVWRDGTGGNWRLILPPDMTPIGQPAATSRPIEDAAPTKPSEWVFREGYVRFRGCKYAMRTSKERAVLRRLTLGAGPVSAAEIIAAFDPPIRAERVSVLLARLRRRLRGWFQLPDDYDPIPCVSYGNGGEWTISLPPVRRNDRKDGAA